MDGQHGRGLSRGSSPGLAGRNGNLGRVVHAPLVGVVATHRGESLKQARQQCCCSNADVDVSMESSENQNDTLLLART